MPLSDYHEPSATVPLGSTELTLFPISLTDFAQLREQYGAECQRVFCKYAGKFSSGNSGEVEFALIGVMSELADLMGAIIAYACREPEAASIAKRLPLPIQVGALGEIWRLTSTQNLFSAHDSARLDGIFDAIAPASPRNLH